MVLGISDIAGSSEYHAVVDLNAPVRTKNGSRSSAMPVTPRLAVVTIVGSLAYLGLAVLGWGGFAAFFAHPARIALAIAVFMLTGVALFSGGNLSPGEREDRGNRWVIIAFALIGLMSAYLPAYTERKGFWIVDGDAIRWSAATILRVQSRESAGRRIHSPTRFN